ncbi:MAG: sulfate adenylyltransferase [Trueperaceae bacterium]|jgi:sulfate adenylyltransferase|nr:sulfate adenylyltransferase [Trueperaceae bacterium]|tara:strand:+ start:34812 stop:35975 length:1164 start_codon:yes stop_codon:yes gene_type:complete
MSDAIIPPHGGALIQRTLTGNDRKKAIEIGSKAISVVLSERGLHDLECLATGVYSPLDGFVTEEAYYTILDKLRLPTGVVWSIPITLQISEQEAIGIEPEAEVALRHPNGTVLALIRVTDVYRPNQSVEAKKVYGTTDGNHPGVAAMISAGTVYLGGPVHLINSFSSSPFPNQSFTPEKTRTEFANRGWSTVVAFQTRNPIHRAHEYLTKVALENVDGLFINPLVGSTKSDDIPADVRMRCYQTLLKNYYPENRVFLGTYPAAMRYAGPREAILHAISRQNYGCTHFIVGRDHAGVGDYYGTYEAQQIFERFSRKELHIEPLKFEHAFFCKVCGQMASQKSCPHGGDNHVFLSGTKVRELLATGKKPPSQFTRPEIAEILIETQRAS